MNRLKIKPHPPKRRIFLVDDHPVTRDGLARLINHEPDLEICGTAGTAAGAIQDLGKRKADLAIVDVSLGKGASGLELIKDLASRFRRLKMLALSTHDETLYAERALRAGASGYVMKQEPTEHVMEAIRKILNVEVHLSKRISDRLLHKMTRGHSAAMVSDIERLSDRELEVFRLLGQGRGTRQIAAELRVSIST
ncbi:MAG: response regulator, partial [Limisphaerales bacterium]